MTLSHDDSTINIVLVIIIITIIITTATIFSFRFAGLLFHFKLKLCQGLLLSYIDGNNSESDACGVASPVLNFCVNTTLILVWMNHRLSLWRSRILCI